MNIFETVKNNISLREAAQAYGLEVNRHGKSLCPFHNDRHPSLYVADDHYYCFACGAHGDVIDFTARLFDLKPYEAAMKLVIDFHLDPDKPPSAAALTAKRIRTEAQKLKENERLCFPVLSDYYHCLEERKAEYAPQTPEEPIHELFVEACHKLSQIEYELNILTFGDSYERRELMLIFCYQLVHIRSGKKQMNDALNILKPDQAQYLSLVKQIKTTAKERKALLAEKKSAPGYNIFKHKELSAKIAELTEKLEELKSEKAFLLHSLEYPEDATSDTFQGQIDRYEDNLKRLEAQEKKYAGELEAALSEYAELKEQASGFDSLELYLERMALRPDKEKEVAQRIEAAYGGNFSWRLMESSKRDVSGYLDEYIQEKAMERELRQRRRAEWPERKMKNKDMER